MLPTTLVSLIQQYGSPLYVYDGDIIRRQVDTLQDAFSGVEYAD